ncbi:SMI1/KNR4 family protein [Halpernia frigidisoli]|uniref:SMI1 / KNR4 family (SUKH-1) n=1 Tax=Halpernia frigidisoli TaxID=1125876 RepID=A0A1I3HI91_9FLAO|nr:SMI1/KNR4 family protein [Halpernia frigidisoli]SFI35381.1 SMI1 / KNR4 family (SUKH-1) [Halpernia frigidisoli]
MNAYEELFKKEIHKVKNLGIKFNNPLNLAEINALELKSNCKFPSDLIDFYQYCDGFETDDYLFRILPLKELIECKEEFSECIFHFAEYIIRSDVWLLNLENFKKYEILNNDHNSKELTKHSNSILEFVKSYLNGGLFGENEINNFWNRKKN